MFGDLQQFEKKKKLIDDPHGLRNIKKVKKSYVMNAQNINIYVDVHITYKVCINLPFMLPMRFLVNSR